MKYYLYLLLFIPVCYAGAQYPSKYTYNTEKGLPSDEVYSLAKDSTGFLWLGCDLGLFRFDGVRYHHYIAKVQKAKSITGLSFTPSGRLYCYNFRDQVFYLERDTLKELVHPFRIITNLTTDNIGNVWISHEGGLASYNEKKSGWTYHLQTGVHAFKPDELKATRVASPTSAGDVFFMSVRGAGKITNERVTQYDSRELKHIVPARMYPEHDGKKLWIFSMEDSRVYQLTGSRVHEWNQVTLSDVLAKRKITKVRFLPDGFLWICTYKGIIRFHPVTGSAELFYPDLSFSDCLMDDKKHYWFSTLQSGLLRVPDLSVVVWNKENSKLASDKITRIATNQSDVFFATINGTIGRVALPQHQFTTFHTGHDADVQSLDYHPATHALWFNINNILYSLKDGQLKENRNKVGAIKSTCLADGDFVKAGSNGTYINDRMLYAGWSREVQYQQATQSLWIAANEGLIRVTAEAGRWNRYDTLLKDVQTLSVCIDTVTQLVYALTFNGHMYCIDKNLSMKPICRVPDEVQPYRMKFYRRLLLVATNKGMLAYTATSGNQWLPHKPLWNVVSESCNDLAVFNESIWLATNRGLYKVPVQPHWQSSTTKVILRKMEVADEAVASGSSLWLNYGDQITLYPEAVAYGNNDKLRYAYRILPQDTQWHYLPQTSLSLVLPAIHPGDFDIELKTIDELGYSSANIIRINGYVKPPFWRNMWFGALLAVVFILLVLLVYRIQVRAQWKKSKQINELNASKLTAIQSQMNPHFIFNSLNSIQDLILKGDVEHSYSYLSTFSHLVRKTLNYSDKDFIDFDQELNLIQLYLSLEKLRFKKELTYEIHTPDADDILIPPLLIQPFIENALVHGLLHKSGDKRITITFRLSDSLQCVIEDNGIGRERAKAIRKRQRAGYESFSGKAIRKRFDILSDVFKGEFGYQYEDIFCGVECCGTRVTLTIPVKRKF